MSRFWLCLMLVWSVLGSARGQEPAPAPDFNTHVVPVFQKYCVGCHNGDDREGKLVLESYETLLAGGGRGPAIVPGRSDSSRIVLVLEGRAKPAMPPEGSEAPTAEEIALLKAWIDAGAKSPTGAAPDPRQLTVPQIKPRVPPRAAIHAAAYSPDGKLIALARYREVHLLSAETRGLVRKLEGHAGNVTAVRFSADGSQLVAGAGEPGLFGEAKLWSVAQGTLVRTFEGHKDSLYAVALSPDGTTLATAGYDYEIRLWNPQTGEVLGTLAGHNGAVYELAFGRDGRILASASGDRTVKLWDVAARARLETFSQPLEDQFTVAVSPDGKQVAAGGADNRIRVWQLSESAEEGTNPIRQARFAHEGAIIRLAYAPDGRTLASAADDRSVKLWEPDSLVERHLLDWPGDWPTALAFSPDSKTLVVGGLDGTLDFYDAASGRVVPPAKPELASIEPRGVMRGQATRVRASGKNLAGATALESNSPKLTGIVVPDGNTRAEEAWLELTPAADLPRGAYELAVVTPGGTSGKLRIEVDDIAQVVEAEPNNTPQQASTAALPTSLWGAIADKGDVDCVRFEGRAGQTIVFDLAASSLGSKVDGVLTLFDALGHVVASNNDFDGAEDPLLAYRLPADGTYTVSVGDLQLAGSADKHFYRLSIGPFAYVTGCYPLSVPADVQSEVELAGYNLHEPSRVTVLPAKEGEITVPLDGEQFRSRRELKVVVGSLAEQLEAEPNNTPEAATALAAPCTMSGRMFSKGGDAPDVDLFRFDAKARQRWIIETDASRRGSPIDTRIEVFDASHKPVERLLLQATRDSYIEFRPINSTISDARVKNWEEMELNQYMYMQGEVCKIFRMPQGPDSGFLFYSLGGQRIAYFDTSCTTHALEEACYIVEPHPPGTKLVPTGLPTFTLHYANDDDGWRRLGRDSRLTFTAPADGAYLVRVTDVRGRQGDRFAYRLTVREPRPDFRVSVAGTNPSVRAGSGTNLTVTAERIDDFDGEIAVEIGGLPPGFQVSSPVVIQAGHFQADVTLYASADAPQPTDENRAQSKVTATASVDGATVTRDAGSLGQIKLAPKGKLLVRLEPSELVIAPGGTIAATLKIERNGFDDLVTFAVNNLPHGVIVDNIGLNGVLIRKGENERQIFFNARDWVSETERRFHAVANADGGHASPPVLLRVRKPQTLAQAADGK